MKNKKKKIMITAIVSVLIMVAYLVFITFQKNTVHRPKIGLILSGTMNEEGWNGMHYEGLKTACENANVQLTVKENVKEFTGECKQAVKELADDKADMIILSSYGYFDDIADSVENYNDISFYITSSEKHADNMTSYFVRMYQARYLSGVLAGMRTQSNQIGYVAAMPNNEVNRGISAFTLGVRSVNPDAEVTVIWSGAWDDVQKEKECTKKLIENCNTDIVTYHQNGSAVIEAAEEYGIESIGYHQKYEGYSDNYLTSVLCNWDMVYAELVKELLSGEMNTRKNIWIGLNEAAVGLTDFSGKVSDEEKLEVSRAREDMLSGKEIFSGLIYDINGEIKCDEGEIISDEELLENFDWYVMGIKFYEE